MKRTTSGFTIVELLIVVVVIAILAVISVVAYQGVQQRATNAAIVDAAAKTYRAVQAYIAANDSYPGYVSAGNLCVTTGSGCLGEGGAVIDGSSAFDTAIETVGNLPRSVRRASADFYGIYFTYHSAITFEGSSRPMLMAYHLSGASQKCGLSNIVQYTWPDLALSTTGYTYNPSVGGVTRCWVSIPGPGV